MGRERFGSHQVGYELGRVGSGEGFRELNKGESKEFGRHYGDI